MLVRKHLWSLFAFCILFTVLLGGCSGKGAELPAGLTTRVDDLADPSYFDQIPEKFQAFFPRPSGAEYIHNGVREDLSEGDSRLNRMMNLLEFSFANHKTVFLQGVVSQEEAEQWLRQDLPVLVIHFPEALEAEPYDPINKIVICGAESLLFYPNQGDELIEEHWPCLGYLQELTKSGDISEESYEKALSQAKEVPWLNLLTYCGFTD